MIGNAIKLVCLPLHIMSCPRFPRPLSHLDLIELMRFRPLTMYIEIAARLERHEYMISSGIDTYTMYAIILSLGDGDLIEFIDVEVPTDEIVGGCSDHEDVGGDGEID